MEKISNQKELGVFYDTKLLDNVTKCINRTTRLKSFLCYNKKIQYLFYSL